MICFILGTRPEIIKMYPVIKECDSKKIPYFILHTGQHYNYEMDKIFFKDLGINSKKSINLNIGSGTHGAMTGQMLVKIEKVLLKKKPKVVLVQGDTNTVIAGALAAVKLNIPIGHIEAGLRSYDRQMPEEHNRVVADHLADYLFAPTKASAKILSKEGLSKKRIFVTGNTIVDSVLQNVKKAKSKAKIKLPKKFILLTLHRQENVDDKKKFKDILKGLDLVSKELDLPIIYPIHPRADKKLKQFKLKLPSGIKKIKPVGFFDFLTLEQQADLILTDSGGIQEEACILKTPCVTIRENTERPETIKAGGNVLAGTDPKKILSQSKKMIKIKRNWPNPFGDGKSGQKIVKIITS